MHPARKLIEGLPEFAERYPLEMVLDPWSDRVRERLDAGEDIADALAVIEELAAHGDARVRNAVKVSFLEAADWQGLGPATEALRGA